MRTGSQYLLSCGKEAGCICVAKVILLSLCFLLQINQSSLAQDTANLHLSNDSNRIEQFPDAIVIKESFENTSETFSVKTDNYKLVLQPNPKEIFKTSFNYRFISFSVNYIPHFLPANNDNDKKGKTKGTGFGAGFNRRNWFGQLDYSGTKGYYVKNTKDFDSSWQPGDAFIQVPQLKITNFSSFVGYNSNTRFSSAAVTSQTERQIKSAGSFVARFSSQYYIINDETAGNATQKTNNIQVMLGSGYQYTFVVKKSFYASGTLIPSMGYLFTRLLNRLSTGNEINHVANPVYQLDGTVGIGYNGERFFAGSYLTTLYSQYQQARGAAVNDNTHLFIQLFAGLRLQAPKALSQWLDKAAIL